MSGERHFREFCAELSGGLQRPLPADVAAKGRFHLLDTIAAIVSGSQLPPGLMAKSFAGRAAGNGRSIVVTSARTLTPAMAALVNGMMAHADETDDSHLAARCHPGCAVVPAALAMADDRSAKGSDLLAAVVYGYEACCRVSIALGPDDLDRRGFSTHSVGPAFGAATAAGLLAGLDARQFQWLMSYTVQQASGIKSWVRDTDHIEKSFDFGGMPAHKGVLAAELVSSGATGVDDAFNGRPGLFSVFAENPVPAALLKDGLTDRFEISRASLKKWSVGSPVQAALDALKAIMEQQHFALDDVREIEVVLPSDRAGLVDNRDMPNTNVQHLLALMLKEGTVSFAQSHDAKRMSDPELVALRRKVRMTPSDELTQARPARQAVVHVTLHDGAELSHRARAVRGTPENPMPAEEVIGKAEDLMAAVIGGPRATGVINQVLHIEQAESLAKLRELLAG